MAVGDRFAMVREKVRRCSLVLGEEDWKEWRRSAGGGCSAFRMPLIGSEGVLPLSLTRDRVGHWSDWKTDFAKKDMRLL